MVVRLVAHGDLLLSDPGPQFSVYRRQSHRGLGRDGVLAEGLGQMVEQAGGGKHHVGLGQVVPAVQEELGVGVALVGRMV